MSKVLSGTRSHLQTNRQYFEISIPVQLCCATMCTVKPVYKGHSPVYKGHSREPENMVFMNSIIVNIEYRLKLYAPFINGKNETALYRH